MAKRKIKEPITGVSYNPDTKLIVQKSRPLSALWNSNLTLSEFKILDTYLSRIDSHKPEKRSVRFEKGELEQLLGVKKINISELQDRVSHLMQPLILVNTPRCFRGLALFEEAYCCLDDDGLWQVDLECTQKAMKYFFNVDTIGYFKYKLKTVTALSSRYSYILFVYLEANRLRKSWEVPLEELKEQLNCKADRYNAFKFFNAEILKKCHKELTEKTPCKFKYEPIKKGRKVTSIKFTLETIKDLPQIDGQTSFFDDVSAENTYSNDFIALLASACNYEFPEDEIQLLNSLMNDISTIAPDINFTGEGRFLFLQSKYHALNLRCSRTDLKPISDRFAYLKKIISE